MGRPNPRTAPAPPGVAARIVGVGTDTPTTSYTQAELLDLFGIADPRIRSLFLSGSIDRRHLQLPLGGDGRPEPETQGELLAKHVSVGTTIGRRAVEASLKNIGASAADIRHLCCVSSTGFITPGLIAKLIAEAGLRPDCTRLDVVGMGCNAGLNALAQVSAWSRCHPGELAVLVCVEVRSAA